MKNKVVDGIFFISKILLGKRAIHKRSLTIPRTVKVRLVELSGLAFSTYKIGHCSTESFYRLLFRTVRPPPERPVTVLTIHPDTLARVSVLQVGFSFSFHTDIQQGSVVPVRSFLEYTLEEHLFIRIFSVVSTTCHCCALLLSGDEMEQGRGRAHRESASHRDVCSICFWTSNFIIIYIYKEYVEDRSIPHKLSYSRLRARFQV